MNTRSGFLYADRKPRINAYGNSFTECAQVSDGETWQEYLAGHFGEPIGNFGVGGYGVYQAYRRMLRVERTADGAQYVIFYVWGDDPSRSIMRCRWGVIYPWATPADYGQRLFNGNPWAHVEIDLETGSFAELENPLSTPESLYAMCDPQWMLEHLRDDLPIQLAVYAGDPATGSPGRSTSWTARRSSDSPGCWTSASTGALTQTSGGRRRCCSTGTVSARRSSSSTTPGPSRKAPARRSSSP